MEGSNEIFDKELWKKIWSSKVTYKKQILMWRILNNYLPTKENLNNKMIDYGPFCHRCNSSFESIQHSLKDCFITKQVWIVNVKGDNNCDFLFVSTLLSKGEGDHTFVRHQLIHKMRIHKESYM